MGRPAIPAEAFDHGDPRRYRRGCKCTKCVAAVTAEVRLGRYLRQTGRGRLTTPDRAARHIERLRAANMPDAAILADALISEDVLYRVVRQSRDIRRATEARILAVKPRETDLAGSGNYIAGIGTARRLRALAADGWTATELGRRCGRHKQYIVHLQSQPDTLTVRRWVSDAVNALYSQLEGLKPEEHGIAPHIAERTRTKAASKGWIGTAWWDSEDIDDPDFQPETKDATSRRQIVAENAHWLMRTSGLDRHQAAARIGVDKSYIDHAFREYPQYAVEVAA